MNRAVGYSESTAPYRLHWHYCNGHADYVSSMNRLDCDRAKKKDRMIKAQYARGESKSEVKPESCAVDRKSIRDVFYRP